MKSAFLIINMREETNKACYTKLLYLKPSSVNLLRKNSAYICQYCVNTGSECKHATFDKIVWHGEEITTACQLSVNVRIVGYSMWERVLKGNTHISKEQVPVVI